MRSANKIYNKDGVYFITSSIVNWQEIFTSQIYYSILIHSINYHIEVKNLQVFAYVIMKNHFHLVCKSENLSGIIQSIKSFTAKKLIEQLTIDKRTEVLNEFRENKKEHKTESVFQIWQEGFYPKEIIDTEELKQKINYIHYNPVKAGYCKDINEWIYSSARFYFFEEKSLINLEKII